MASYRIGIGSFNLKDGNIGIGTETTGFGNLKVEGTIKTTDLDVGVSTLRDTQVLKENKLILLEIKLYLENTAPREI